MRIGIGYDIHKLVVGRKLILGGIEIPYNKGLLGHSDGDVLLHAIGDAILGAAGKRDIGYYFPDTDPKYKDISSILLLKEIIKITNAKIINIDSIIICEKPKLLEYIPKMIKNISQAINMEEASISIKAKTNEGLGIIGNNEAIASISTVLMEG